MSSASSTLLKSSMCTQAQLETEVFQNWAKKLGERPEHMHRKVWEWCFIVQALYERNLLQPSKRGLGFAVGTEPLAALFCSLGASICATDLFLDEAQKQGWVSTNEHAAGLEMLNSRNLCSETQFKELCTFRPVDMNYIPEDLQEYDFIWSSCSLEHLGSLKHGENFIYNAMRCLKPGGIAVHTTEYNFSSNQDTVERGGTVLYRRRDIEKIVSHLRYQGHNISIDFTSGDLPHDQFIDVPPYKHDPHLKLKLEQYVITSMGLIVEKRKGSHL